MPAPHVGASAFNGCGCSRVYTCVCVRGAGNSQATVRQQSGSRLRGAQGARALWLLPVRAALAAHAFASGHLREGVALTNHIHLLAVDQHLRRFRARVVVAGHAHAVGAG